ncbi:MAG: HIT family protein [Flavobacteriales bacterium]|jgi:histidine triad (HIT) family protein
MSTIFSRIISGEIPCHKIAEDDRFLCFLDIQPVAKGHSLVIPKDAVDYIFDMDDEALAAMHLFSKRVAKKIKATVPCLKIGIAVVGLEVPHAHIHLIPLNTLGDINFQKERLKFTPDEYAALAAAIREA